MKRPLITEHTFFKYTQCPAWVHRDFMRPEEAGDRLMETLQTEGLLREHSLKLIEDKTFVEVEVDDIDEASQYTLELMKKGTPMIYRGVLLDGHFVARPAILERVEGRSNFGDWYYIACDIKRSERLKEQYQVEGVFYADVLKRIQGIRPVKGYVLHASGAISSYLIEEHLVEYHHLLDEIKDILAGKKPEHFLTSGYKQSPWFDDFVEEVRACNHLSIINRIWRSEVTDLEQAGIKTVEDLASASLTNLTKIPGITLDRLYFLQQQALSLVEDRVIVLGNIDLPEEAEVALVVDIESDPLRDIDYLFGVLLVDGENQTYHPFLAKSESEAAQAWMEFVNFLNQYQGANLYHYGWYEYDVFKRLAEKHGAPDAVKEMFENKMIDVLPRMREAVVFPSPFYSLKDLAKILGFSWRHAEASGLNSILWYERWLQNNDEKALQDTIDYNEDDVRATWFVREFAMNEMRKRQSL